MMDDVFGNSSGDTVMEADLSRVLANLHQDIADLQYLQQVSRAPRVTLEAGKTQPIPQPRTHQHLHQQATTHCLRHTQSEVAGRVTQTSRPRALSAGATTHQQADYHYHHHNPYHHHHHHHQRYPQTRPQHGYVNLQPRSPCKIKHCSQRPTSSYDNVPETSAQITQPDCGVNVPSKCASLSMQQSDTPMPPPPPSVVHMPTPHSQPVSHVPPPQPQSPTHLTLPHTQSLTHMPPPPAAVFMPPPPPPPSTPQTLSVLPVPHSSTPYASGQRYVNVPLSAGGLSPVPAPANNSGQSGGSSSSSAPATPQQKSAPRRLHHSYIELWSGVREERDSLSDSECEDLKRSFQEPQQTPSSTRPSPGYVEMSSPYVKSPQVSTPFTGSILADFASRLAFYAGHQPRNIFCPFCPRYFGYEKSLGSHIHKAHRAELNTMVENGSQEVQIQLCPICQAHFFNTSVLPKHLIDFHRASVVEILEKNNCIISDAVGIQCPFCSKKVPHGKTGEQVLLYHMQQLHLGQYEEMIKVKFQPTCTTSLESIRNTTGPGESAAFHPRVASTPGLSNRLAGLAVQTRSRRSVEALDLDTTWSSHTAAIPTPKHHPHPQPTNIPDPEFNSNPTTQMPERDDQKADKQLTTCASKGILRHQSSVGRKPSVKRELRFSVPPVTSEEIFIPESPQQDTPDRGSLQQQQTHQSQPQQQQQQMHQSTCTGNKSNRVIPVRVDSLSAADFMDLNDKRSGQRKRRRLGLGLRSRKAFKKKDKENIGDLASGVGRVVDGAKKCLTEGLAPAKEPIISTTSTRTFRRPKPVAIPRVPELPQADGQHAMGHAEEARVVSAVAREHGAPISSGEREMVEEAGSDTSPFTHLKLYSPLRMFRCNGCRVKFCDNESLGSHIASKHRGLLCLLRPQYGCGVCSAKFFENKYLVKHCLQHHTSLLEIRSPTRQKITMYRFTHE